MAKCSFGVIALRADSTQGGETQVLMIRRKASIAMCDFLYGNTKITSEYIKRFAPELTADEHRMLMYGSHEGLFAQVLPPYTDGLSRKNRRRLDWRKRYIQRRLVHLRRERHLRSAFLESPSKWMEQEWEFPKGRRDFLSENAVDCALREFQEETAYHNGLLRLHRPATVQFLEEYVGTDSVTYRNTYFLGSMLTAADPPRVDGKRPGQRFEISGVAWFQASEALRRIRPSSQAKMKCLQAVIAYNHRFPIFSTPCVQHNRTQPLCLRDESSPPDAAAAESRSATTISASGSSDGAPPVRDAPPNEDHFHLAHKSSPAPLEEQPPDKHR